jgi:hypothetical protein
MSEKRGMYVTYDINRLITPAKTNKHGGHGQGGLYEWLGKGTSESNILILHFLVDDHVRHVCFICLEKSLSDTNRLIR